jgi:DDE superfamily endonuclease
MNLQKDCCFISNLAFIVTTMILGCSMCLSKIVAVSLGAFVVNTLSHCFSYAGLDGEALMKSAMRYAIKTLQLLGVPVKIAIDDTMKHHSKFSKTIYGVFWLFDHVINGNAHAKCIVFAYLIVNETIRFPIGWRVFEQVEKSKKEKGVKGVNKWELALELLDEAVDAGLTIEVVLFDSWFCVYGMIQGLKSRNLHWISEIKAGQIASIWTQEGRQLRKMSMKISKLFEHGKCLCKELLLGLKFSDDVIQQVLYSTSEISVHIKALKGNYKLVHSEDNRTGSCKIFITDELSWEAQKILTLYSSRWLIEEFFKNAKGSYGFEKATIRKKQGASVALFLVSFTDLLISIQLHKNVLENPGRGQLTVSAIQAYAQEENLRNLIPLLEDEVQRQRIIDALLAQLKVQQSKRRKPRKSLVIVPQPPTPDPIKEPPTLNKPPCDQSSTEKGGGTREKAA